MEHKLFICLANSKKYTQRCIAGIELAKSSRRGFKYDIVKQVERPVWLRPVSQSGHGEIEADLVDHINLLDVVEVKVTAPRPQGYQSENVLFEEERLSVVDTIGPLPAALDRLLAPATPLLFGNRERTVSSGEISKVDHSLVLIKPKAARVYATTTAKGSGQVRAGFMHEGIAYDLPVTDIGFIHKFSRNPQLLWSCEHLYFTVSLGIQFESQYYKLVAGIVYF
jgi:hypothetical protein